MGPDSESITETRCLSAAANFGTGTGKSVQHEQQAAASPRRVRMTDQRLADELAARVMGWRLAPGRYIKSGRSWLPRWRFAPLSKIEDAFCLLDAAHPEDFAMRGRGTDEFWVGGRLPGGSGEARDRSKPRAIARAVASAIGIDLEEMV